MLEMNELTCNVSGHMHSREHGHQLKDVIGRHSARPSLTPQPYPFPERVPDRGVYKLMYKIIIG